MIANEQLQNLTGTTVYGTDGEKIGRAGQVYIDDDSGQPEWLTVNTGFFGTNESFVPLRAAELTGEGVTVAHCTSGPNTRRRAAPAFVSTLSRRSRTSPSR